MKVLISLLTVCFFISGCCVIKPPKRWTSEYQNEFKKKPAVQEEQVVSQPVSQTLTEPVVSEPAKVAEPVKASETSSKTEQIKGEVLTEEPKTAPVVQETKKPEMIKGEEVDE